MTKAPTNSFFLSMGTAIEDRAPPYLTEGLGFGSVARSSTMNHLLGFSKATKQSTGLGCKRALTAEEIGKSGRHIKHCCWMK